MVLSDLQALATTHRERYVDATPWPHLVLDGLLDSETVAAAESQELAYGLRLRVAKSWRQVKAESTEVNGQAAKDILDFLASPTFVAFLEQLTGISGLIADQTHYMAGLHVSPPGAFQALHRDFRKHPTTGMYHRVNVLVYLNSNWPSEYGGELELWSSDKSAFARIPPEAGKVVIFEANAHALHGVPDPIQCPPGRARLSLACYYYTQTPGDDDRRRMYFTRPKRPQDPWFVGVPAIGDFVNVLRGRIRRSLKS